MKFKILICSLILSCSFLQTYAYDYSKLQYESINIFKYKTEYTFKDYCEDFLKEKSIIEDDLIIEEEQIINFIETDEILYATTSVNIRSEPNKDSEKIGVLLKNQEIKRIGIGDNGWSKVIYNNQEYYINSSYLNTEKSIEVIEINKQENLSNNISNDVIKKEGNVQDDYILLAKKYFNKLPQNVQNFLINNNVKIYITDTNLANRFFNGIYSSVMGATVYSEKTIYIEDRNKAIKESTIHEIGHMIDYLNGTPSLSQEFQDIYNSEKETFVEVGKNDDHSTISAMEYFAEVLNQAILYPDSCNSSAPRSYEYVINIINNL